MASFNTINAYDAYTRFPAFHGLMQSGDGINADPRFAASCKNVDTRGGVLMPAADCVQLKGVLNAPIKTVAMLHRRWEREEEEKDLLVAASAGKLFVRTPAEDVWTELAMPAEWGSDAFASDDWSTVSYEINEEETPNPIDVLLLSNAKDGMIMLRGDTKQLSTVATPKKFGVIERYAERIWGGAIEDDPDMLVYSAPYDPTNWEANVEIPEDGAGDIQQPSWDGDSFTSLKTFGSQLIAFKKNRVWRVLGTNPGEYTFKEQYGSGAPYAATIALVGEAIYLLTDDGVAVYDGLNVQPFGESYIEKTVKRINREAISQACACIWRDRYYLALPLDGSAVNNAVLIYDTAEKTFLLREGLSVEAFLPTTYHLYYASSETPGALWEMHDSAWDSGAWRGECEWVSPWNDLNYKNMAKSSFVLYIMGESKQGADIQITLQTEKRSKTKIFSIPASMTTSDESALQSKQKKLTFSANGRRFRLIIRAVRQPAWRIVGGLLLSMETDVD